MALGSNLHNTPYTFIPFLWRRSKQIERQTLRFLDQYRADDSHHIGDALSGREVRLNDRGVGQMHTHRGSLVHPLSLQLLQFSLCARFELRIAFSDALFPLHNVRNEPRILDRIARTRRTGRVRRSGIRGVGRMHHLGLHVHAEIARIHAVLRPEHQQIPLRNLALEALHATLQLPHTRLRALRAFREFHCGQNERFCGVKGAVGGLGGLWIGR